MKTILQAGLVAILLTTTSCTKENPKTPHIITAPLQGDAAATTHYIGESYGGGIIFFIDTTGEHGLIAAAEDIGIARWYNSGYIVTGAIDVAIGKGAQNTRKIIQSQGRPGSYAALLCAKYSGAGYKDWFLPSQEELNELFKQKAIVRGFMADGYWSSTESARHFAWYQYFVDGYQNFFLKSNVVGVRAVRAF